MKSITLTDLKSYLSGKTEKQLAGEITELFRQFSAVRDYYTSKLNSAGSADILEKYKNIIRNEFFPTRGFGKARLSVARKAVNDLRKVATSKHQVADIMLFYVEQGSRFTNEYGDIDERFYTSMESMYESALQFIADNSMQSDLQGRCALIVENATDGWGFYDSLSALHDEFLGNESEKE
ncbi:MAG: DUF6155 family protein [Gammaproteobacteria bacterium]|jgi:hypothetical protein